jgi:hypothetical protein
MSNETIFREVDEELRGDRMRAIWKRVGPYVIGGAIAVVLVVAANEGWAWWQNSNSARSSDQFYAALELAETDVAGAQAALNEIVTQGTGGYPTLARFRQASLLARDGKRAESIAAYDALAAAETNQRLREIALVLAAYQAVDDGDIDAVQLRVGPMAAPDHRMRNAAREAIALTQFKAGELDAAAATIEQILLDPLAGQEIRQRAQVYLMQLVALGAKSPAAIEAEAAAAAAAAAEAESAPAVGDAPAADAPAEPSVGDAPALDVTEPAAEPAAEAAPDAEPAAEPAPDEVAPAEPSPAAESAPAAETTPAPAAAAPAAAREKGAADAAAALAASAN